VAASSTRHASDAPCPPRTIQFTGLLAAGGANILANDEFVDRETGRFFTRTEFAGANPLVCVVDELQRILPQPAHVRLGAARGRRIVVQASREHHCLAELLIRHAYDELHATIEAVVSNHPLLETLATRFAVPFHCVPHLELDRRQHEEAVECVLDGYKPD
jgi:formyltetrahydrofolate deformylase